MTSAWTERGAAVLLAVLAFLLVVGMAPLDPTNIAWLGQADAATNYLGWAFYRASPWGWPLAANPAYGLDIAGSVMMADANPLLAIPFKALSPLLPTPFQYFGWWLLACFILQAQFARAVAAKITPHIEQRLAITVLFLFAPFFLIRIATPAVFHMTLVGQWQILAAFWLYLSPDLRRRALAWTALLGVAVLTHPYLLAIVAAIWLADVLRSLLAGREPLPLIVGGAALAIVVAFATAKISGVFWLQKIADTGPKTMSVEWGFAIYKANLLTAIDPDHWSYLLPDLKTKPEQIEGFAYLGLGVLLLAIAALVRIGRLRPYLRLDRQHWPLIVILAGCGLFALSNSVELGQHMLHLPWPGPLIGLGNMFRSTGRFVWPLAYAAIILIVWMVARGWRRPIASLLLVVAAIVQVADTRAGWGGFSGILAQRGSQWPTTLQSPFWTEARGRYRAVRLITPRNHVPYYQDINSWALANGMASDVIYLARYDTASLERLVQVRAAEFREGRLARDTLWIIDGEPVEAVAAMPRRPQDFLGMIDGLWLYAPGFKAAKPSDHR